MKRRTFISYAGAAAALPVMPLPASAVPVAAAPVHTAQVGWAALIARVHNTATPALLQKWMGVSAAQSEALMGELITRNIIKMPSIGAASATHPMFPSGGVPKAAQAMGQLAQKAREVVDGVIDDALHDDDVFKEEPSDETA